MRRLEAPSFTARARLPAISFDPLVGDAVFWIAVACCLVAQLAITRSAFRSPAGAPSERHESDGAVSSRASEVVWTIIPAVMLALVLVFTWRAMHPTPVADRLAPAASAPSGNPVAR